MDGQEADGRMMLFGNHRLALFGRLVVMAQKTVESAQAADALVGQAVGQLDQFEQVGHPLVSLRAKREQGQKMGPGIEFVQ